MFQTVKLAPLTIYRVNYLNYISDELKDTIYAKLCAILIFHGLYKTERAERRSLN